MTHNLRNENLDRALSAKKQRVIARSSKTPLQLLFDACRSCLRGNWKAAKTNFSTATSMVWTLIVNPNAGANRKP